MELLTLVISLLILGQTTIMTIKNSKKPLLSSNQKRKVYVDTSALMDPRLLAVAQTGFIGDDLIVPRSVTNELQLLADGKDSEKRLRARAGLDAVRELERVVFFNLTILGDALDHTPVDNRLLELAKANHGLILTNDFNLRKVAATEHVDTLSINELALVMRNQYLPGERTKVKVVSAGSNPHQGVGYLRDGTMVVIDQAKEKVGQEVEVEFIRLNQTSAGSMMFAKLVNNHPSSKSSSTSISQPQTKGRQSKPAKAPKAAKASKPYMKIATKFSNRSGRNSKKAEKQSASNKNTSKSAESRLVELANSAPDNSNKSR